MRKTIQAAVMVACALWGATTVAADKMPWQEYGALIKTKQTIGAMGADLFGEQVNLINGGLSFSVMDVSIPGNNALPVEVRRVLSVKNRAYDEQTPFPFADWDLDTPRLSGVFAASTGWASSCSSASAPGYVTSEGASFLASEYWQGNQATLLNGGGGEMLAVGNANYPRPSTGGPYKWVTSDFTYFSCIPALNRSGGEGFLAITADGTKYWFNWHAGYVEPRLRKPFANNPDGFADLARTRAAIYATRVEDRFGNWVAYDYTNAWNAPAKLEHIDSSDGRHITLGHAGGRISTINDGSRTWFYGYANPYAGNYTLSTVTLPDTTQWSYDFDEFLNTGIEYEKSIGGEPVRSCANPGIRIDNSPRIGTATSPSGATAAFTLLVKRFGRTHVPQICGGWQSPVNDPNDDVAYYPMNYDAYALVSKQSTGVGLTPSTWTYSYGASYGFEPGTGPTCTGANCGAPPCPNATDACDDVSTATITGPDGNWIKYSFGTVYRYNEGKLLKTETGNSSQAVLRTVNSTYLWPLAGTLFAAPIGNSPQLRDDSYTSEYLRPMLSTATVQQGVGFLWQVENDCQTPSGAAPCFNEYARPTKVTKASTLGFLRTEITEYYNNHVLWVNGLVKKLTCTTCGSSGVVESESGFDSLARVIWSKTFGALRQVLTYYAGTTESQFGTVATVSDANDTSTFNTIISLSSWKRGVPQSVAYPGTPDWPAGVGQSALVNDDGTLNWTMDELGSKTAYDYDDMGRLKLIDYVNGDVVNWMNTDLGLVRSANPAYGLPANHWQHKVNTGAGTKITYLDAMWRPVVEESYDSGDVTNTRSIVVKRYDTSGRLAFQSYPMRTLGSFTDTTLKGSKYTYDALDRPRTVVQDSELGALTTTTDYLDGFKTRVTNPKLKQTTTDYLAYDQPVTDWPIHIVHPEGVYTDIGRDDFGKPTWMRRRNAGSTVSSTRYYTYYNTQELCRVDDPESGTTAMGYDDAGNMTWSASGFTTSATACLHKDWVVSRRADRTYDQRGRLKTLAFADGQGDQTWSYERDGLVSQIVTANTGAVQVTNAYTYNLRRLLAGESMAQPGYTWALGYGFNALGHAAVSLTQPGGEVINFNPNALSQAREATSSYGAYATNVTYHPNGAISTFDYGNGISHRMDQNDRGLPEWSVDFRGASFRYLDDVYQYDKHGNVSSITDAMTNGPTTRTMTYDDLDRLKTVASPMFTGASYQYDVLDNLTRVQMTGGPTARDHYYCYNAMKQLDYVRSGPACTGTVSPQVFKIEYDPQGNVEKKGAEVFEFDLGNRLRAAATKETYRYDGHGRRVMAHSEQGLGDIRSIYGNDGVLRYQRDDRRSKVLNYIYLGGSLVAVRETPYGGGASAVRYQHTDALGSPVRVTDANRDDVEYNQYEPYGKVLNHPPTNGPGYTGHVMDAATGLNYMQQRYYDPGIGRFLSVDPVTANSGTGANFNRYWYANNNPYKFTDPDGRESACFSNGVGCGLTPITPEIEQKQAIAMGGLMGVALLAVPDPTDVLLAALPARIFSSASRVDRLLSKVSDFARTKGPTKIGTAEGGLKQAQRDFKAMKLDDVKPITDKKTGDVIGQRGTTSDGRTVVVRDKSTDGRPTIEVRRPNGRGEEIRYNEPKN